MTEQRRLNMVAPSRVNMVTETTTEKTYNGISEITLPTACFLFPDDILR